jgi:uracil-DNA glycosylase family 4
MELTPERRAELLQLARSARARLETELELGLTGLPVTVAQRVPRAGTRPTAAPAPAARPPSTPAPVAAEPAAIAAGLSMAIPDAPRPTTTLGPEERRRELQVLAEQAATCNRCVLHEKRAQSVFARGSPDAELVFVGEGPGRDEDIQGLPFVGAAGQLLDKMITAMGYGRDDVYICNVVKCRPPENRTPRPEEALACSRFLIPQLHAVSPKVIVGLGRCAAQALGVAEATGAWRGRWGSFQGIPVLPTYHPAFLLRTPEQKRTVWEDLQLVMARLGKSAPKRR